jgi:uncharacterized protein (TIGR02246 family)
MRVTVAVLAAIILHQISPGAHTFSSIPEAMKYHTFTSVITFVCLTLLPRTIAQDAPMGAPAAEDQNAGMENALRALAKTAENFVGAYNRKDAAAISALFTPGGEFVGSDGTVWVGRQVIEGSYKKLFAGEDVPRIALEALEVRFIAPGVAIENGLVHPTLGEEEHLRSFAYTVTHVQQADGSWLMASSRNLSEISSAAEQIEPLHWLVGQWTFEGDDGMRIDMVIRLDDGENYLLGEALVSNAEQSVQTTSLRIGWNPATASVYWWTFDSDGGNASGHGRCRSNLFIPDPHARWRFDGVEGNRTYAGGGGSAGSKLPVRAPCAGSAFPAALGGDRQTR